MIRTIPLSILVLGLLACSGSGENPGALEGTWKAKEPFPVTVTFRSGEMEAMGSTKKVSYQKDGDVVLVTYKEGVQKDRTFRYTVVDDNTVRSDSGTFHRSQ